MYSAYCVGNTLLFPSTPKVYANVPVVVFCPVCTSRTVARTRTCTRVASFSGVAGSRSTDSLFGEVYTTMASDSNIDPTGTGQSNVVLSREINRGRECEKRAAQECASSNVRRRI